jgi:hypothetical protein
MYLFLNERHGTASLDRRRDARRLASGAARQRRWRFTRLRLSRTRSRSDYKAGVRANMQATAAGDDQSEEDARSWIVTDPAAAVLPAVRLVGLAMSFPDIFRCNEKTPGCFRRSAPIVNRAGRRPGF